MFKSKKPDPIPEYNLLELRPLRNLQWEDGEEEKVVLLVPRFRSGPLARWLMPRLPRPDMRVKLDELGSFLWRHCDGETTVEAIGLAMKEKFGDKAEPLYERLGKAIRFLEKEKFLLVPPPPPSAIRLRERNQPSDPA